MKNKYEIRGDCVAIFIKRRDGVALEVLISLVDFPRVSSIKGQWIAGYHKSIKGYYIETYVPKAARQGKGSSYILLHRFIMEDPRGMLVDHRDRDTLNNQRDNLRTVTAGQNLQNLGLNPRNTSGFRGVSWNEEKRKWKARVTIEKKEVYLKYFTDKYEAAKAVKKARAELMPYSNE